jgi:hypothetical protein
VTLIISFRDTFICVPEIDMKFEKIISSKKANMHSMLEKLPLPSNGKQTGT